MTEITGLVVLLSQRETRASHRTAFTALSVSLTTGTAISSYPTTLTLTKAAGTLTVVRFYVQGNGGSRLVSQDTSAAYEMSVPDWATVQGWYTDLFPGITEPSPIALDVVAKCIGPDDVAYDTESFTFTAS